MSNISSHKGAVSIFIVVFTALLITVVTVSFVRLMIRDQQRASDSDLSKSAYDSALAGVEDAKRALVKYYQLSTRPDLTQCNGINRVLVGPGSPTVEVPVQTNSGVDGSLNQAYTCVKVNLQTDDYIGELQADEIKLVALRGAGSFDRVRIQWFSRDDISGGTSVNVPGSAAASDLVTAWPANRPPVLETQLIQTSSSFQIEQFDSTTSDSRSNTNTLFLYPKNLISSPATAFTDDVRRTAGNSPTDVDCEPSLASASALYSCSTTILMPEPVGGSAATRSNAFLRLTARYNKANVNLSLYNGSNMVRFDGVQPEVDSTGRANDLFRRVSARVETGINITYPEAAVDITGNFCKTFAVTDRVGDYQVNGCTP